MVCVTYGCKFATSDLWSNCFVYKGCVSSLKYQQYNDNYPDHSQVLYSILAHDYIVDIGSPNVVYYISAVSLLLTFFMILTASAFMCKRNTHLQN